MKVVPVIDLLNGVVVHAVRGERKKYKPLQSILSTSADPLEIAKSFQKLGFGEIYVADLNAIAGDGTNYQSIKQIATETGLRPMVDAGSANIESAKTVLQQGATRVIIGTETLTDIGFVAKAVQELGSYSVVVSLDLKNRQLLGKFNVSRYPDALALLNEFQTMGVKQVIVLDLARVGAERGVDLAFLSKLIDDDRLSLFVGGGVRNMEDLLALREVGAAGVLLATALHSGKITVEQIVAAGLSIK